ncbi:MAG: helix-turn-helix domain-containing protein [Planctomycetota bacterium]
MIPDEHRGNPLPQHIIDQFRRLRRDGMSVRAIANASGVAKSTVEKYCGGPSYSGRPPAPRPGHSICLEVDKEPDESIPLDEPDEPDDETLTAIEHEQGDFDA